MTLVVENQLKASREVFEDCLAESLSALGWVGAEFMLHRQGGNFIDSVEYAPESFTAIFDFEQQSNGLLDRQQSEAVFEI